MWQKYVSGICPAKGGPEQTVQYLRCPFAERYSAHVQGDPNLRISYLLEDTFSFDTS